jgi:hypothetical protein
MTEEILIFDKRSSCLVTSRIHPYMGKATDIVSKYHQFSGQKVAEKVNFNVKIVRSVLTKDPSMKDVCDKMVLKNLESERNFVENKSVVIFHQTWKNLT